MFHLTPKIVWVPEDEESALACETIFSDELEGGLAEWTNEIAAVSKLEMGGRLDESKLGFPTAVPIDEVNGLKRVRVEIHYTFETLVKWPLLPNSVDLSRAVEMRTLRW